MRFVSHSIESWFDVKIEAAIESGLNLGRAALDEAVAELSATGQTAAATLAGQDAVMVQGVLSGLTNDVRGMQNVPVVPIFIKSVTVLKGDKLVK